MGLFLIIFPTIKKPMKENDLILLGRRIRSLRNRKGWTQQELGRRANINYKFIGEIERGKQNPSFNILSKIASTLNVEMLELFRFEHEMLDKRQIEIKIKDVLKNLPENDLRQFLLILRTLYPLE